ncbi:DUF1206 domain-containing protein [Mycobacterium sp. MYCO198283]|uniref:DUF1206 domain-containing protein n=1 Tax=Mycobacterium sp. MYCO198283 TaxID=2883505 RepID=UPI001E4492B7|nr:DUF1206 domain-containing protein [Mycobacterium sp. MYCO198283]MCG5431527.1 DUF1206 domain-containing protein [Mycobacterium sp. MYCO198283]
MAVTVGDVDGAMDRAAGNRAFRVAARAGYLATGVLHLLLAYIVVRLTISADRSLPSADQSGALATMAAGRGGAAMLWATCAAFAAIGLFRAAEIVTGTHPNDQRADDRRAFERLKAAGLAAVYFALAWSAAQFAMGGGTSAGAQNAGLSARLMQSGAGRIALIGLGALIVVIGGYHVYKGVARTFVHDLTVQGGPVVVPLGVTGYVARGIAIGGVGVLVILATLRSDPAQAAGLDVAVKLLGQTSWGKAFLVLAALGFVAYGAFSFASARLARM